MIELVGFLSELEITTIGFSFSIARKTPRHITLFDHDDSDPRDINLHLLKSRKSRPLCPPIRLE